MILETFQLPLESICPWPSVVV